MLNSLEEDTNRLLVVNTAGNTEVESLRLLQDISRKIFYLYFISFNSGLFSRIQRISFERKIKYIECNRNPFPKKIPKYIFSISTAKFTKFPLLPASLSDWEIGWDGISEN